MKSILTFCIPVFLIISLTAFSQDDITKGKEILETFIAKHESYSTTKSSFTMTISNRNDDSKEIKKGILFLKSGKFRIEMDDQTMASDKNDLWLYLKEDKEVIISDYVEDEIEINPATIFTAWKSGYSYIYVEDVKINNKTNHFIELTPEDKEKSFFKVKLYINTTTKQLTQAVVFYKDGNILTFDLDKIETNLPLKDSIFTYNKDEYDEDVVVTDLRDE